MTAPTADLHGTEPSVIALS